MYYVNGGITIVLIDTNLYKKSIRSDIVNVFFYLNICMKINAHGLTIVL